MLSKGLVLDLNFTEKSGTVAGDSSRYSNDGALTGCKWVEHGLEFNGTSDYVNCGNDASLNITEAITISSWIYPTGWGESDTGRIIDKNQTTSYMVHVEDDGRFRFYSTAGVISEGSNVNAIELNKWQYVVVTYDKADVKFYVDGNYVGGGVETASIGSNSDLLYIGNRAATDRSFDGSIDQVRIHNRALNASEIKAYYDQTKHKYR